MSDHTEDMTLTLTGIATAAALITAVVACFTLWATQIDSRERSRPVVTARFEAGPKVPSGYTYLVIKNNGASTARNVTVTLDPAPRDTATAKDGKADMAAPYLRRRYAHPIQVLAPGQALINIYAAPDRRSNPTPDTLPENPFHVADEVTVAVEYDSHRRIRRTPHRYTDTFSLDLRAVYGETSARPGEVRNWPKSIRDTLHSLAWETWQNRL